MKYENQILPELGLKYTKGNFLRVKLTSSKDSYAFFKQVFDADTIEYSESFFALFLSRSNVTIGYLKVSSGGTAGTVVDAKMIFAAALKAGAHFIILAHNHPSGNLKPSDEDLRLTKNLVTGAKFLDLKIVDHLIITESSYYSFADEGKI